MKSLEDVFIQELTKNFSLKVDLRTYEDFVVKTEDGKVILVQILNSLFF